MSVAELQALKQEVIDYLDTADEEMLRSVYEMLERAAQGDHLNYTLTPEQNAILEERMEKYNRGEMKFSSWEEVEARVKSGIKNGL